MSSHPPAHGEARADRQPASLAELARPDRWALHLPILLALILLLAGCETIEGAGRDLQDAGQTITEEAQDAQTP